MLNIDELKAITRLLSLISRTTNNPNSPNNPSNGVISVNNDSKGLLQSQSLPSLLIPDDFGRLIEMNMCVYNDDPHLARRIARDKVIFIYIIITLSLHMYLCLYLSLYLYLSRMYLFALAGNYGYQGYQCYQGLLC